MQEGLRARGLAKAAFSGTAWPASQHDVHCKCVGLVRLADPVRPAVPEAVRACETAGIRVPMITEDYPGTAQAVARLIGLIPSEAVVTGAALAKRRAAGHATAC